MMHQVFHECIAALDDVTAAFNRGRRGIDAPSRYEADMAAFLLMQQVWIHVNAVSHISSIPYTGSHLISAWVLARAAFEAGVTAYWLCLDNDWKTREAKWLGWIRGKEKYWRSIAEESHMRSPEDVSNIMKYVGCLAEHREAITKKLPRDSYCKRPTMREMLKEVGAEQYYLAYRVASHAVHGGPGADEWVAKRVENIWHLHDVVKPHDWKDLLRMASWSVVQPSGHVLTRAGVSQKPLDDLVSAHKVLIELTERL